MTGNCRSSKWKHNGLKCYLERLKKLCMPVGGIVHLNENKYAVTVMVYVQGVMN
jgi:hypothetical protein